MKTWKEAQHAHARAYWASLLEATKGNVCAVARLAGVHRQCVYKLLKRYEVDLPALEDRPYRNGSDRRGTWGDLTG